MNPHHRILITTTCLGILALCAILLLSGEEEIPQPKDMSTHQLVQHIKEEDSEKSLPPKMAMVKELLHRHRVETEFKKSPAYPSSISTLKHSLQAPSLETQREAFHTLITYPTLLEEFEDQESRLRTTAKSLNAKAGQERYQVLKVGEKLKIQTNYVLRPLKVLPSQ